MAEVTLNRRTKIRSVFWWRELAKGVDILPPLLQIRRPHNIPTLLCSIHLT